MKTEILNKRFLFFVLQLILFTLLILAAIMWVNSSLDAAHVISSKTHEEMAKIALGGETVAVPENYNERIYQLSILDHISSMPETIVIGSSRGMYLGKETTGFESIYNHCVSGACLEDYYAMVGLYRQKYGKTPPRVIMEVSPWVFYSGNPEARWVESFTYRNAAQKLYAALNGKELKVEVDMEDPWLSLPYFQYNYRTLRRYGPEIFDSYPAHASTDPDEPADRPDGTIRYAASKENESPERLALVRSISGPVTYQYVQHMTEIDPGKRSAFENLVREMLSKGTEVVFYLSPFSVTQCSYSYDEGLNPAFPMVEDYLYDFAAQCGAKVVGAYEPQNYGLTDERFLDDEHLDKQGTAIVWAAAYK